MVFLGAFTSLSIGKLFMSGVFPGILLATLFSLYIGIRTKLSPSLAPSLPPEERATWKQKVVSAKAVILPIILIFTVLGTIYLGITTPTEASTIGAIGALIIALVQRKMTWKGFWESTTATARLTTMVMWTYFGGIMLSTVLTSTGLTQAVQSLAEGLEVNRWFILIGTQIILFIMAMFMESFPIIMITMPAFLPMITALGFNPLWFGLLFIMNTQMGWLTPPVGLSLFYLRAIVPKGITMADIIRSCFPFIVLQAIGLAIVMAFPQIAMWLPNTMIGK
jgi:tripartite ATP-independent transporter DctM subunit